MFWDFFCPYHINGVALKVYYSNYNYYGALG